jgi:5-formyltetrahydrofolate cyclo-ligase
MNPLTPASDPKSLRKWCREQRRSLSHSQQIQHAKQATLILLKSSWLQRPKKIAVFLSQDGELGTNFLIQALWQSHHRVYLPVLKTLRGRPMAFAEYLPKSKMFKNHFKMLEPHIKHQHHLHGKQLDLILVPLTCFDEQGHRIGMGGGFYDRAFAFKRQQHKTVFSRPKLIGWAHECQKVSFISSASWDVPLDALISEQQIYHFKTH